MTDSAGVGAGATASALMDAAEERFAAEGFERASLRAIMRAAGTDPGAVHYHFGGREELAASVLDRVLVPLNDHRLALLDDLERNAPATPIPMTALVEALVRPDLDAATRLDERGRGRARLVGLIYLDPAAFVTRQVEARFSPVAVRFLPHLIAAAPRVDADLLAWRVRWCLYGTLGALLTDPGPRDDRNTTLSRLVSTLAPALAAPNDPNPQARECTR